MYTQSSSACASKPDDMGASHISAVSKTCVLNASAKCYLTIVRVVRAPRTSNARTCAYSSWRGVRQKTHHNERAHMASTHHRDERQKITAARSTMSHTMGAAQRRTSPVPYQGCRRCTVHHLHALRAVTMRNEAKQRNENNQPPPPLARCVPQPRNRGEGEEHHCRNNKPSGDQAEARCCTRCALRVQYSSMSNLSKLDLGFHELCSGP